MPSNTTPKCYGTWTVNVSKWCRLGVWGKGMLPVRGLLGRSQSNLSKVGWTAKMQIQSRIKSKAWKRQQQHVDCFFSFLEDFKDRCWALRTKGRERAHMHIYPSAEPWSPDSPAELDAGTFQALSGWDSPTQHTMSEVRCYSSHFPLVWCCGGACLITTKLSY